MDFIPLKPEQRKFFEENGFLVVRGALDADSRAALVEAGDRRAESFLHKAEVRDRPEYNHLDLRPGLLDEQPFFTQVSNSATVPLIVQLLGPNIHLHSMALIYKRPEDRDGKPFRRGWHRDIRIAKDLGHRGLPLVGIKICYCLSDFHQPNSGMTLMAARSHLKAEPLAIRKGEVDPENLELTDLVLNAGDAVFFENRLFHTATPNRSNRVSKVLIYGYAYRWLKPEVYLESLDKRLFDRADPITRQLLGGYRDVDTAPWALQDWTRRHGIERGPVAWTVDV